MYLICKFSGTWSLYNGKTRNSRALQPQQVELIKDLFSDDLRENAILDTLQVIPISANKVQQLTATEPATPVTKKAT